MNTRYDLNMEVPPREAVRLLYISKSRFGGDWRSVPHTHACTEMFYCVSGRGQFNIEGKLFDVAPDDLIIVNPRVQHTELSYQTYPLEYIVLGIDGAEFLFNEKDLGYTMLSCGMMREELLFLMRMLLRDGLPGHSGSAAGQDRAGGRRVDAHRAAAVQEQGVCRRQTVH